MKPTNLLAVGLLMLSLATVASAGGRWFDFTATVEYGGLSPWTTAARPAGSLLRLFPGESIHLKVAGDVKKEMPVPSCETLVAGLEPRLVSGSIEAVVGSGDPTPRGIEGMTWEITQSNDCDGRDVSASLQSSPMSIPAGEYSLVVMLNNPVLQESFGSAAASQMRTTVVKVIAGPAANQQDEMWRLLKLGRVALQRHGWQVAQARAFDMLALDANSAMAHILLGQALQGGGDPDGASAAYTTARNVIENHLDPAALVQEEKGRAEFLEYLDTQLDKDE